ncbi:MAG: SDR family oxidoreductase [Actinobacteria bacterium]|nr:SDR family oxidoreductase [Actinomycetota bacterium]
MSAEAGPLDLSGQGAVVVGAGGGIGRAAALLLAQRQASVLCLDRDATAADATVGAIAEAGGTARAQSADVTDPASLTAAFAAAVASFGQVHAVINCAGIQGPLGRRSHEVSLEDFDAVYAINLRGALAVSQMALPHMLQHGYGRIAHVASIAGKEGNPNMIGYSSTKAGLIGMVKAQGKEYAEDGITINALAPAVIRTPFLDTQPPEVITYMTDRIPMKRTGTVREAAQLLAWMVSPACSFTTGFTFDLSGGRATY